MSALSSWSDPHQPGGPTALTYPSGDATVIAVSGALEGAGVAAFDRRVTGALDQWHRHLVLDLHMLRSVNTEGLGVLWAALRRVRRRHGTLSVTGVRPSVRSAVEPLVPYGLHLHTSVRSAVSAVDLPGTSS